MLSIKEGLDVKIEPTTTQKYKDVVWEIDDNYYVVKNVPHMQFEDDYEEYVDSNVSIILFAIRDLMLEGKLPNEVDFERYKNIQF